MSHLEGAKPAPKRLRGRLSIKTERPQQVAQVGTDEHSQNSENLTDLQQFEVALWHARNVWDIGRRRVSYEASAWLSGGSLAGGRLLDRHDADKMLAAAMDALSREVA